MFFCVFIVSVSLFFFFLVIRLQPRSTLFPYTTLFRSIIIQSINILFSLYRPTVLLGIVIAIIQKLICKFLFLQDHGSDRKSTRLNSSHSQISYAVFCLKKKKQI